MPVYTGGPGTSLDTEIVDGGAGGSSEGGGGAAVF